MQRCVGAHDQMPEALADLRARGMNQFSDAADVDLCRVVVDAQLRRAGVARDVRLGDTGPSRQRGDQSADAAVLKVAMTTPKAASNATTRSSSDIAATSSNVWHWGLVPT